MFSKHYPHCVDFFLTFWGFWAHTLLDFGRDLLTAEKGYVFQAGKFRKSSKKVRKNQKNQKYFCSKTNRYIRWCLPNMKSRWSLSSDISRKKNTVTEHILGNRFEHFPLTHLSRSCLGFGKFSEFSEICSTLRSCISELNEYFFKISKDPERSMSRL